MREAAGDCRGHFMPERFEREGGALAAAKDQIPGLARRKEHTKRLSTRYVRHERD